MPSTKRCKSSAARTCRRGGRCARRATMTAVTWEDVMEEGTQAASQAHVRVALGSQEAAIWVPAAFVATVTVATVIQASARMGHLSGQVATRKPHVQMSFLSVPGTHCGSASGAGLAPPCAVRPRAAVLDTEASGRGRDRSRANGGELVDGGRREGRPAPGGGGDPVRGSCPRVLARRGVPRARQQIPFRVRRAFGSAGECCSAPAGFAMLVLVQPHGARARCICRTWRRSRAWRVRRSVMQLVVSAGLCAPRSGPSSRSFWAPR